VVQDGEQENCVENNSVAEQSLSQQESGVGVRRTEQLACLPFAQVRCHDGGNLPCRPSACPCRSPPAAVAQPASLRGGCHRSTSR